MLRIGCVFCAIAGKPQSLTKHVATLHCNMEVLAWSFLYHNMQMKIKLFQSFPGFSKYAPKYWPR